MPRFLLSLVLLSLCGAYGQSDGLNNGGVRGYEDQSTLVLSQPVVLKEETESSSATLSTPAIVAIVLGCIAIVALIMVVIYRRQTPSEPTTPRDDVGGVPIASTKSNSGEYQQSFDQKRHATLPPRPLEPHSPKMPPPHLLQDKETKVVIAL